MRSRGQYRRSSVGFGTRFATGHCALFRRKHLSPPSYLRLLILFRARNSWCRKLSFVLFLKTAENFRLNIDHLIQLCRSDDYGCHVRVREPKSVYWYWFFLFGIWQTVTWWRVSRLICEKIVDLHMLENMKIIHVSRKRRLMCKRLSRRRAVDVTKLGE